MPSRSSGTTGSRACYVGSMPRPIGRCRACCFTTSPGSRGSCSAGPFISTSSRAGGFYADKYIALEREQAAFCYLTARALRARLVVEFGTSFGVSTLWLAAAVRANGGGRVIGTELVPDKVERARAHVEEAGLSEIVEIREGDARQTLRDLPPDVDLLLNDGFPNLALEILQLVAFPM